jgi:Flp pilus assembly pilin Flp
MQRTRGIRRRKKGQGLTEYAILIATVSLGLILLLGSFRTALGNVYRNSASTLRNNSSVVLEPVTSGGSGGTAGAGTNTGSAFGNLVNSVTNAANNVGNALTNFLNSIFGGNGGGGIDF